MRKIVVISDSFKGTLSSSQVAQTAKSCILKYYPDCEVVCLPVADGGEGTVECFLEAIGGTRVTTRVTGPWGESVQADYARIGETAVIEMAAAAGLPMVGNRKDPSRTTTFGVGEQIRHAVEAGAKRIVLGLGGSATNDGGCGAAAAMGVVFKNGAGEPFCPVGATLGEIAEIDVSETKRLLGGVSVEVMCDIANPLCGPGGAAAVFGPQKGADSRMIAALDAGLSHMAHVVSAQLHADVAELEGAGAAGGFGAGSVAFFGAALRPGIEVVLDMVDFDAKLQHCDLVITGEGRIDGQSLGGKVPVGVARRAKGTGVPVVAIVGIVRDDAYGVYDEGITAIFATNRAALPFEEVKTRGAEDYRHALEDVLRYTKAVCGKG